MDDYTFNITPFWIRIYNIPFEQMDRQVAIDVREAIGEVVVINWPLRRVVHLVENEGTETVCAIKMPSCLVVNLEGRCGVLVLMWKEGVDVAIQNYSSHHIDSLDILKMVESSVRKDWIVSGDFNAIINNAEKDRDRRKCTVNSQEGVNMIKERLDSFLLSANAIDNLHFLATNVVRKANSDHNAILLDTMGRKPREDVKDSRLFFKFDAYWGKEKKAKDIIKQAWSSNKTNIIEKFERVCEVLSPWQYRLYRRMKNRIHQLVTRIDKLINGPYMEFNADMLKISHIKLGHLYAKEGSY
ncbi:hypothetical protein CXB51_022493 [Gossypium anomalum]|uniref:DUF4283 domain-containing protein n=1 Tax=Gossypium anomalum TaxID=47600 RepID=A0A8J6CUB4_9ROSI|nr:hypothetical protein CXB51_022493 [Gossypium anomalum]